MFLDFSKLLFLTLTELLRRAWLGFKHHMPYTANVLLLPAALAEASCARRLERMVRRLNAMGAKIDLVRAELRSGRNVDLIESDRNFRHMLGVVKTDMGLLQREAAAWQHDRSATIASARLGAALSAVARVSERLHGTADVLLWELAERDRLRGGRPTADSGL
ncbi:hypothetical protein [Massilia sp. DWR3-1-1]|uniref:hypothetical protein n=1 Tax=Massilia sp. DWR3-1-1 TaxID=2804559 RepID=UPI003CEC2BE0